MDNVLYSNGLVFSVLGNLSNNPQLFHEKSDVLKEDLFLNDFHKVVFNAIQTMTYSSDNATEISVLDVDTYLKAYPTYYKTWEANNGVDFLNDAKNNANVSLFDSGVDTLNKYLLLRTYDSKGIDIHDLYRYDGSDEERNQDAKTLQGMSVSDITEYFTQKVIDVRENFDSGDDGIVKFDLKDDIESLVGRLSEEPEMGLPFSSPIYNWLFRGMRGGKYMLRSAESGSGKTRQAMRDMLFVSATERYLPGYGTWQDLGPAVPTLMISTELNKIELQTIALAYITGLTTSQIEDGNFNVGEQERLEKGVEIIKKSNIKFVYIDDFSANDIQMLIEEHVMKYDTKIVVFDYIQSTPKLTRTLQDGYGHQLREDEVLAGLSRRLKFLAEKFDIFIMSATQLNAKSKDDSLFNSRDANAIRGSRAVVDKIDYGIILARPTPLDLKALSKSVGKEGFGDMTPDYATFVYKNRAGLDHIVLWSKNNLGNMNDQFMYATDYNYNLIDVKEIEAFVGYEEEYQEETNDEVVF